MDLEACRLQLLESIPDADVRSDQCDVLRVNWHRLIGFLGYRGNAFHITVADADRQNPNDIHLTTHGSSTANTEEHAVAKLISMLSALKASAGRSTPLGNLIEMLFHVDSVNESSLILGRNDDVDIPVGTVFSVIGKTRLKDKTTWTSNDVGSVESIQLTLVTVHWYGREIDYVPRGHTAGLAVSGNGLELVAKQLAQLADGESLYLAATKIVPGEPEGQ